MTTLVLKTLPRFPAHVSATNGLTAVVTNGVDLVIQPNYGDLVPVPAVTNPAMTYFMAWDKSINYYQAISFTDLANNLAGQVLGGSLTAIKDLVMAANQAIYFTSPTAAAAYNLSIFVRGISGSADAAAFKTALSLTKTDVGLSNVDNTSDAGKPVSTAQQTALNLKAPLASPSLTGTPTAPTAAAGTNTTQIATTAFVQGVSGGRVLQTQSQFLGSVATGTTLIPDDDTIPQITEGDQYLSVTITPSSAASILEIDAQLAMSLSTGAVRAAALFQGGVANALEAVQPPAQTAGIIDMATLKHRMVAGTTSPLTFSVRAGPAGAATMTINGAAGARKLGGVMNSFIQVKEISV